VHGLRCYVNITRTRNVSEYMLVLALCLVCSSTIASGQSNLTYGRIPAAHGRFSRVRPLASCNPSNACLLGPTRVHNPNGISIGSVFSAGLTSVTVRHTHYNVCNNRPHLRSTATRAKKQYEIAVEQRYLSLVLKTIQTEVTGTTMKNIRTGKRHREQVVKVI